MSHRRKETMDVYEVLRLVKLGRSNRRIATALGINRKTVGKYRSWAEELGLLAADLPSLAELHQLLANTWPGQLPQQNVSTVAPYRQIIVKLRDQGVETAAIHQRLREDHNFAGSYSAVWRFVNALAPTQLDVVVRVEVKPGEEGQVDFGYAGLMSDPATGGISRSFATRCAPTHRAAQPPAKP